MLNPRIPTRNPRSPARAAYLHIPFCLRKCAYCDFNSYAGRESLWPEYVRTLGLEIRSAATYKAAPLETVYLGGGTPTVLSPDDLLRLLDAVSGSFGLAAGAEVSIEANPGTVTLESLRRLRNGGFNRLSLGAQSFDDDLLNRVGRVHTADEAVRAYLDAREAGFDNVGVDLICALPGQDQAMWESDLRRLTDLRPEHASLYELTLAQGTPLAEDVAGGRLAVPDEDTQLEMLLTGLSMLTGAGYDRYEVSNYALPGFKCRHNQTYWRCEDYHGFGAGACSFIGGARRRNVSGPEEYIGRMVTGKSVVESSERPDEKQRVAEMLMLSMRTTEGLDLRAFKQRFGYAFADAYPDRLSALRDRGLAALSGDRLQPTKQGILLADEVAGWFL